MTASQNSPRARSVQKRCRSVLRTVAKTVWQRTAVKWVHQSFRTRTRSTDTWTERGWFMVPPFWRMSIGDRNGKSG